MSYPLDVAVFQQWKHNHAEVLDKSMRGLNKSNLGREIQKRKYVHLRDSVGSVPPVSRVYISSGVTETRDSASYGIHQLHMTSLSCKQAPFESFSDHLQSLRVQQTSTWALEPTLLNTSNGYIESARSRWRSSC